MKGVFFIMLKKEMAIDAKIKAVETKKNDFIESILPNKLKNTNTAGARHKAVVERLFGLKNSPLSVPESTE